MSARLIYKVLVRLHKRLLGESLIDFELDEVSACFKGGGITLKVLNDDDGSDDVLKLNKSIGILSNSL